MSRMKNMIRTSLEAAKAAIWNVPLAILSPPPPLSLVFVYDANTPNKQGKLMHHYTRFQNPSSVDHNFNTMRAKSDKAKIKTYTETKPIMRRIFVLSFVSVSLPVKYEKKCIRVFNGVEYRNLPNLSGNSGFVQQTTANLMLRRIRIMSLTLHAELYAEVNNCLCGAGIARSV
jgi:hypothetical protein